MKRVHVFVALLVCAAASPLSAQTSNSAFDFSISNIMRGPELYGRAPSNTRWTMDGKWIYGNEPDQIYSTIAQGRPDGMPSFGARVPDQQIWQLVAYVQSLGADVPRDAAPSRDDDLSARQPELRLERMPPRQTGHR